MPTTDLWPDFTIEPKPRGVRQILEEAGRGLKEKTKGLVTFMVHRAEDRGSPLFPFRYRCDLYVENLDYAFPLLDVNVSINGGFPVGVVTTTTETRAAHNEAELTSVLATIFRAEETKTIIQNLISMATE